MPALLPGRRDSDGRPHDRFTRFDGRTGLRRCLTLHVIPRGSEVVEQPSDEEYGEEDVRGRRKHRGDPRRVVPVGNVDAVPVELVLGEHGEDDGHRVPDESKNAEAQRNDVAQGSQAGTEHRRARDGRRGDAERIGRHVTDLESARGVGRYYVTDRR